MGGVGNRVGQVEARTIWVSALSPMVEVREAAPASFLLPSFGGQFLRAVRATAGPEVGENLSLLW